MEVRHSQFPFDLKSLTWRNTAQHRKRWYKPSSCLIATLNRVPLYSLVCVACKGPPVAPLQAASLSRIHMWTGHNCRLCCQEKRWLRVPIFSNCPFFIIKDDKDGKITGVSSHLPSVTLTKVRSFGSQTSKVVFQTSAEEQRPRLSSQSISFTGWCAVVLFCADQTQHKCAVRNYASAWLMLCVLPPCVLFRDLNCYSGPTLCIFVCGCVLPRKWSYVFWMIVPVY